MWGKGRHPFRDIDGDVADPFELGIDLEGRHQEPEIDGHRLRQGKDIHALAVDQRVELIHLPVPADDLFRPFDIPFEERATGGTKLEVHLAPHLDEVRLERLQFFLEVSLHISRTFR